MDVNYFQPRKEKIMVIQHNLTAMNSNRMLGITTGAQAKSSEKLSSGYKINRAADDAAGLSISEKMRRQIRGLTQASANAEDGISAVQTAEGALNEVHDMLQRMNELAVKSANSTDSESDREAIQAEIDQITAEIDRVSETTKFNETYLLKGDKDATKLNSFTYKNFSATAAATVSSKIGGADFAGVGESADFKAAVAFKSTAASKDQNAIAKSIKESGLSFSAESVWDASLATPAAKTVYSLNLNGDAANKYDVVFSDTSNPNKATIRTKDGTDVADITITATIADDKIKAATATTAGGKKSGTYAATTAKAATNTSDTAVYYDKDGNPIPANALSDYFTLDSTGATVSAKVNAPKVYDALGNETTIKVAEVTGQKNITGDLTLKLHVGADSTENNQISVNIASMSAKSLGVNGLKVNGSDDSNARNAIEVVKAATQKVSNQRSALGAIQNRLEHTIKNLDNVIENTTAAESLIRDTDMAEEMVKYSNNNILMQAGQAMLAQANQSNQGVLALLS